MNYYEVLVSSSRFHGKDALTYCSEDSLSKGQVVVVPLQRQNVVGVVSRRVEKPSFKIKQIGRVVSDSPIPESSFSLIKWLRAYYPAPLGSITSLFLPSSLLQISRTAPKALPKTTTQPLQELTGEQRNIVKSIEDNSSPHYLLHGDTGTGKTRLYLELSTHALNDNKSVLLLTPEIGLTPQLEQEASRIFGSSVIVLHSNLTPAARRNTWLRILQSNRPLVIIGPRSALFSPLSNIGLVILDEFHDSAYKQEQTPYYQSSRVAAKLASLHGAKLVLGSATPPVSDYYVFQQKGLPLLRMSQPAIANKSASTTAVKVVGLTDKSDFTRSAWLSNTLLKAVEKSLSNQEQALIFLNRRGTARLVMCQACAWQALCPRCDLPLTYHGDTHSMRCHTCGYAEKTPADCPDCHSTEITFKSIGTKAIYDEISRLHPKARIQRFDSDTKKSENLEALYSSLKSGEIDILVGTQLLTKGLDLPRLSLVGIVVADTSLSFPDYTAEERTFQMLNQIIGRVNRGHRPGTVVLQTYHPDSLVLKAAINKDYDSFYEQQIKERRSYGFPPFNYVLKVGCERASQTSAQTASQKVKDSLKRLGLPIQITGPSPAFTEKVNNRFRWQLIIKSKNRQALVNVINSLPANSTYDIDPSNLL